MQVDKFYWEFSFDLFDNKVKKYYGKKSYKKGWEEVGRFLIKHGFDNKDDK